MTTHHSGGGNHKPEYSFNKCQYQQIYKKRFSHSVTERFLSYLTITNSNNDTLNARWL